MPQSNPIIVTFDDPATDDDEDQQISKNTNDSTDLITDEEHRAIKRLQQPQEGVVKTGNTNELTAKTPGQKVQPSPSSTSTFPEAIPSTDELSALLEKR